MSNKTNDDSLYGNISLEPDSDSNDENNVAQQTHIFDAPTAENYHHHSHHHSHSSGHHSHSHKKARNKKSINSNKKKKPLGFKIGIGILIFLLCLIVGGLATFLIMRSIGKNHMLNYDSINVNLPSDADSDNKGRTIQYKGHTYTFNTDIASILFMGIDNTEIDKKTTPGTAGQADALYLLTYNTKNGKIKVLSLNRDIITKIDRFDQGGAFYDTAKTQLCLAYAYGDGNKLSAENQVKAVKKLLYNIPISSYYSIDLSALEILNDVIGGVTLTPQYTFRSFTKGEPITITGRLTEEFVRYRDITLLDDNLRRMACQKQYLEAFSAKAVAGIKADLGLPLSLYNKSKQYTVTNLDAPDITYLSSSLATNFTGLNMVSLNGKYKMVKGDASAEFKPNKTKLFETVLDLFYIKQN